MLETMRILSIEAVTTVDSPRGRQAVMWKRPNYGITFCYEGQITYEHNGQKTVSDKGHMVLLPKGESYTILGTRNGRFPLINVQCTDDFQVHEILSFPIRNPENYLRDYERLKELYFLGSDSFQCMSILYGMLSRLVVDSMGANRLISRAMAYISDHYMSAALTNAEIAAHLGISDIYLCKIFRDTLHISPRQYLIDLRMKKARQLLSEGSLCVNDIALQCGYSSVYHFSRAFRITMGMSPSQYRHTSGPIII